MFQGRRRRASLLEQGERIRPPLLLRSLQALGRLDDARQPRRGRSSLRLLIQMLSSSEDILTGTLGNDVSPATCESFRPVRLTRKTDCDKMVSQSGQGPDQEGDSKSFYGVQLLP